MTASAVMFRRARRVAVRSPWRTTWTALLVVIPVAVGIVALSATWGHHVRVSSAERHFGRADAIYRSEALTPVEAAAVARAVAAELPEAGKSTSVLAIDGQVLAFTAWSSTDDHAGEGTGDGGADAWLPADAESGSADIQMADWGDPVLEGMLSLNAGRTPRRGEVVLSPRLSSSVGAGIGDRVRIGPTVATLDVVGIGTAGNTADGLLLDAGELVPVPGSGATVSTSVLARVPEGTSLPSAAVIAEESGVGEGRGLIGLERRDPDGEHGSAGWAPVQPPVSWALVALFAVTVVSTGIVAGAAFGIGARRRLRANGLLAANGADRAQIGAAAAAEAVVVAAPAAVVGLVGALAVPPVWIHLRLPGWVALTESAVPWPLAVTTVAAAVLAAASGAVEFSRALRTLPASALLDGRERAAVAPPLRQRAGVVAGLGFGALVYLSVNVVMRFLGTGPVSVGGVSAIAVVALWGACAVGAMWLLRRILDRDPIGRLVERDLRRHRLGSTAAVLVVATWVFVAVGGTATELSSVTMEPPDNAETLEAPALAGFEGTGILVSAAEGSASRPTGMWVQRESAGSLPESGTEASAMLVERTSARLADAGLSTSPAVVSSFTGRCEVCPDGFVPTVLVLEHAEGAGLAPGTVDLLRSGVAVTPFDVPGVEDQKVAGVAVRIGPVPSGLSAAVLASSVTDGSQLSERVPVLVADTSRLDTQQVDAVVEVLRDTGLSVTSWDHRIDPAEWIDLGEWIDLPGSPGWGPWPWLVVLVVVTLVVTSAHRREHGDTGRLLAVLGAEPRAGRRLSSLAALSLAGVGVAVGLTAVSVMVAAEAIRRQGADPMAGLWNRDASFVAVVSLVIPVVVGLLAWLMPVARSDRDPDGALPA